MIDTETRRRGDRYVAIFLGIGMRATFLANPSEAAIVNSRPDRKLNLLAILLTSALG
ncbi:MAG: hypothetical protein QNJ34_06965 [Xenococcaceae cyanobacterium MO_188.B29]|nr:hypothetical protein [Xenococcaceae cyanobacterium MO_188.B29]